MSEKSSDEFSLGEIIGNTLADLRKNTGMTQKEFSAIFGVSESSIAHYEQGITIPSADMLLKYAVLKIKPCKRNNRQNFDHTKNAVNKATLRSDPTQAAE